jgi:hypothetical protein
MKSNSRLDDEIKVVANMWNTLGSNDPYARENEIAAAVYRTLRWSRGCREDSPIRIVARAMNTAKAKRGGGAAA